MKYLRLLVLLALIGITGSAFYYASASSLPVGGTQYYLSGAGITSSATTIQLTSFKTPDGRAITMANFGTVGYGAIDPQTTTKIEDISFTGITQNGNGTAVLTGVTRGLDFIYPYASSVNLSYAHSGGATFIITNTAGFYYNEFAMQNNANVNTWPFASTSPATKGYVDFVAFNGAAVINANTTNKGVVQIGTAANAAASTGTGSTGATLVIPTSVATSTFNAATSINVIPVTGSLGTIDQGFLPASTTKAMTFASSTYFGSTYAFDIGKNERVFTASSSWPVPQGIHKVFVRMVGGGGTGAAGNSCSTGGSSGGYAEGFIDVSATSSVFVIVGGAAGSSATTTSSFGYPTFGIMATVGGNGGNTGSGASTAGANPGGLGIGGTFDSSGNVAQSCISPASGSNNAWVGATSILGQYGSGGSANSGAGSSGAVILEW